MYTYILTYTSTHTRAQARLLYRLLLRDDVLISGYPVSRSSPADRQVFAAPFPSTRCVGQMKLYHNPVLSPRDPNYRVRWLLVDNLSPCQWVPLISSIRTTLALLADYFPRFVTRDNGAGWLVSLPIMLLYMHTGSQFARGNLHMHLPRIASSTTTQAITTGLDSLVASQPNPGPRARCHVLTGAWTALELCSGRPS